MYLLALFVFLVDDALIVAVLVGGGRVRRDHAGGCRARHSCGGDELVHCVRTRYFPSAVALQELISHIWRFKASTVKEKPCK